jgi:predicted GIY-YIG superfamily endonuclease
MPIRGVAGNLISRKTKLARQTKKRHRTRKRRKLPGRVAEFYKPSNRNGSWHIYVLKLKHGCYYVGITSRDEIHHRYKRHIAGKGAQWTRLHPPISVYETYEIGKLREVDAVKIENRKTLDMIKTFGIDRVRGGQLIRSDPAVHRSQYEALVRILKLSA